MNSRAKQLFASLLFTWLFFAEYLSPLRRVHIPYDLEGYHYPLVDYAFQSLKEGRFPQWDWNFYSGMSFAGNLQAALFYPPTWLMFLANAGRDHISYQSLQAFQFAHVWLGAVLCFCWLRARGLGGFASVAGAQVFAFSGYVCLQLQHQGLITAFAWYPLAAWGIDDAAEQQSWQPLWKLVLASGLCFLTGYPPMWMVFAVTMTMYAVGRLQARLAWGVLLGLGASLLLAMVQILPAWQAARFMQMDADYGGGIKELGFFLSYLLPNFFNFGMDVPLQTNPGMEYLYLGAPGLIGLVLLRFVPWRTWLPGVLVVAASMVLLTNPFGMVWAVIRHSALLGSLVRSWYFLAGTAFGAAMLAAVGIDGFLRRKSSGLPRGTAIGVAGALLTQAAWELWRWFHQGFPSAWDSAWITVVSLLLFGAGLLCLRGAQGRLKTVFFVVLTLFSGVDYKVFGTSKRINASSAAVAVFHADSFANMDGQGYKEMRARRQYRVLMDPTAPVVSIVRHWGVSTPQGFDPLLTEQYKTMLGRAAQFRTNREFDVDPADEETLHLLGVRYFVTGEPGRFYSSVMKNSKFRLIGSEEPYYKTFEYLDAVPAYGMDGGEAEAVTWNPEQRGFRVRSAGGMLHLSEQWMPGWSVRVDGREAALERWHGAFQAVAVPAGEHLVEFRYAAPGMWAGAVISFVMLVGCGVVGFRSKRTFS